MLQEQKAACPLRNGARSVACTAPAPGSPALGTYREMDKRQDPKTGPCRVSFRIGDYR